MPVASNIYTEKL